jgi:Tol biopolymer transport system component
MRSNGVTACAVATRFSNSLGILGLSTALLLACSGGEGELGPGSRDRQIVFSSAPGGQPDIFVINEDGSGLRNLTRDTVLDVRPVWSPDGRRIAFTTTRDGLAEIYVMDADGTNVHNLTNSPFADDYASWSGDGTKIAFRSERDGDNEIWIMGADGSNPTQLTFNSGSDDNPQFAPSGNFIAFTDGTSILVVGTDGSSPTTIGIGDRYQWSRSGQRLAWVCQSVAVCSTDMGSGVVDTVAVAPELPWLFDIAPDGQTVAYGGSRDGNYELYLASGAGPAGITRLTTNPAFDCCPLWSPDGVRILFYTERDGPGKLYSFDPDGRRVQRITPGLVAPTGWGWRP